MVRISEKEAERLGLASKAPPKTKQRKYKNEPCTFKGIKFDSIKERDYYIILLDREKKGEIYQLQRQVKINIQPRFKTPDGKTVREINYNADFVYMSPVRDEQGIFIRWDHHIVDVKGGTATKTAVYRLKKKLLAYKGFYIEEV